MKSICLLLLFASVGTCLLDPKSKENLRKNLAVLKSNLNVDRLSKTRGRLNNYMKEPKLDARQEVFLAQSLKRLKSVNISHNGLTHTIERVNERTGMLDLLFEGDIVLTERQAEELIEGNAGRWKRQANTGDGSKWLKGVPYAFRAVSTTSDQGYGRGKPIHVLGRWFNRLFHYEQISNADGNIQPLVDKMLKADIYKAGPNDYKVNYGNKVSGTTDKSKNDLFYDVNEEIFKQPVYDVLIKLVENGVFYKDVCETEKPMDGLRKTQVQKLLDTWTDTEVFRLAYEYMHAKNEPHSNSFEQLKKFLFNFWFGTYSRCSGAMGSSGFEHVFTGEWKEGTVGGHHSWVTYYLAQKKGKINYHGYYTQRGITTGTF